MYLIQNELENIIQFFQENKTLIITDILRGRGGLSAEWFLVTRKNNNGSIEWILKDINSVCNFYSQGEVEISPRGSLKIGRVTMQRNGLPQIWYTTIHFATLRKSLFNSFPTLYIIEK